MYLVVVLVAMNQTVELPDIYNDFRLPENLTRSRSIRSLQTSVDGLYWGRRILCTLLRHSMTWPQSRSGVPSSVVCRKKSSVPINRYCCCNRWQFLESSTLNPKVLCTFAGKPFQYRPIDTRNNTTFGTAQWSLHKMTGNCEIYAPHPSNNNQDFFEIPKRDKDKTWWKTKSRKSLSK